MEWDRMTYLISGVATGEEILRGEETEAIGLLHDFPSVEKCLLILPGTHSKHLQVEDGEIKAFTTFMTGELFDVLGRHSILRATIDLGAVREPNFSAFDAGVRQALDRGLAASIFKARTRGVLKNMSSAENTWFLSGVLVGAEVASVQADSNLLIGGARGLRGLYARAFGQRPEARCAELPDELVYMAVPRAHALFLQRQ
jgi:2-dehydro-3-deoxygalactonokinase